MHTQVVLLRALKSQLAQALAAVHTGTSALHLRTLAGPVFYLTFYIYVINILYYL